MSPLRDPQDPARLCDAAAAVLNAAVDFADFFGRWVHPLRLVGTPYEPSGLAGFTRSEIEAACEIIRPFCVFEEDAREAAA